MHLTADLGSHAGSQIQPNSLTCPNPGEGIMESTRSKTKLIPGEPEHLQTNLSYIRPLRRQVGIEPGNEVQMATPCPTPDFLVRGL